MSATKLWNPKISLKEVKDLWFEAKKIVLSAELDNYDVETSIRIFNKGQEIVGNFWQKWLERKIQPTDEELNLLEEAFNEASWAFNFLTNNYSTIYSAENNEVLQKKLLKINKSLVKKKPNERN